MPAVQNSNPRVEVKPLTKWVGNKRGTQASAILSRIYDRNKSTHPYLVAPFGGMAGEVFDVRPYKYLYNDLNSALTALHQHVMDGGVPAEYAEIATEEIYYSVRDRYNELKFEAATPEELRQLVTDLAWLIKACHGGLYRENKSGGFNVPVDKTAINKGKPGKGIDLCPQHWHTVGSLYRETRSEFYSMDYHQFCLDFVRWQQSECLFYFDPPYMNSFDAYSGRFQDAEHQKLAELCLQLADAGNIVTISNSWNDGLAQFLSNDGFFVQQVSRRNSITRTVGDRRKNAEELFACNIEF